MGSEFAKRYTLDARRSARGLQSLMGIVSGLVCDGHLNDNEIRYLKTWMNENEDLANIYPANIVYRRVREILIDDLITEEERNHLTKEMQILTGNNFIDTGAALPEQIASVFDDDPHVIFEGNIFVFTGEFLWGTRKECFKEVDKRGGIGKDFITNDTNYLVIGTMASPDWIVENFGRKIQKAAEMVQSGDYEISIIREVDWTMALK
jgi:NAD-dependent DNA ligase